MASRRPLQPETSPRTRPHGIPGGGDEFPGVMSWPPAWGRARKRVGGGGGARARGRDRWPERPPATEARRWRRAPPSWAFPRAGAGARSRLSAGVTGEQVIWCRRGGPASAPLCERRRTASPGAARSLDLGGASGRGCPAARTPAVAAAAAASLSAALASSCAPAWRRCGSRWGEAGRALAVATATRRMAESGRFSSGGASSCRRMLRTGAARAGRLRAC